MLARFFQLMRVAYISSMIRCRHALNKQELKPIMNHPSIEPIWNTLANSPSGVFVHWGVYESGKSTAVRHAAQRLQDESGRLVFLSHGWDFSWIPSVRSRIRHSAGIPLDCHENLSDLLDRPATIIFDHFDSRMRDSFQNDTLEALRELAAESTATQKFNVLLVVTSWEIAMQLRDMGCKILDCPRRWTADQLALLFTALPAEVQAKFACRCKRENLIRLATLSGTPGYLTFEAHKETPPSQKYARVLNMEWQKGMNALEGIPSTGSEPGWFPDKNGVFHHRRVLELPCDSEGASSVCACG